MARPAQEKAISKISSGHHGILVREYLHGVASFLTTPSDWRERRVNDLAPREIKEGVWEGIGDEAYQLGKGR
jgi:hypothetical protein